MTGMDVVPYVPVLTDEVKCGTAHIPPEMVQAGYRCLLPANHLGHVHQLWQFSGEDHESK